MISYTELKEATTLQEIEAAIVAIKFSTNPSMESLVIGCYHLLRHDPFITLELSKVLDEFYDFVKDIDNDRITERMPSLCALRNDMMLQYSGVDEHFVDRYFEEIKAIIAKKGYLKILTHHDLVLKVCEIVAKIQYANTIIGRNVHEVKELYDKLIREIHGHNKLVERYNDLQQSEKIGYDYINLSLAYMYYGLFRNVKEGAAFKELIDKSILHPILAYWNSPKIAYYRMSYKEFQTESFGEYNFIWM